MYCLLIIVRELVNTEPHSISLVAILRRRFLLKHNSLQHHGLVITSYPLQLQSLRRVHLLVHIQLLLKNALLYFLFFDLGVKHGLNLLVDFIGLQSIEGLLFELLRLHQF